MKKHALLFSVIAIAALTVFVATGCDIAAPTDPPCAHPSFSGLICTACNKAANIGDTGPGGGKIFFRYDGGFTVTYDGSKAYYLEAAPVNVPGSPLAWAPTGSLARNRVTGAEDTSIGAGRKNTEAIKAAAPGSALNAPAANACLDYRGPNSKTDWFLPSINELMEQNKNRSVVGIPNDVAFWSSTQVSPSFDMQAKGLRFGSASTPTDYSKELYYNVRPIRAF
jgi:hypothetical protein